MARFALATLDRSPLYGLEPGLGAWAGAAAAAGFEALGPDIFSLRTEPVEALAANLDAAGLAVCDVAALNIGADVATTEAALAELDTWCAALAPEWVLVKINDPADATIDAMVRTAGQVLGARGARLGIEPSASSPIDTIGASVTLLERVGLDDAGVVVDSWHFLHRPRWNELADLGLDRLAYIQLSGHQTPLSSDDVHETMHRRTVPDAHDGELRRFVEAVRAKGFDGWVCAEVLSETERATDLPGHARRLRTGLSKLWG